MYIKHAYVHYTHIVILNYKCTRPNKLEFQPLWKSFNLSNPSKDTHERSKIYSYIYSSAMHVHRSDRPEADMMSDGVFQADSWPVDAFPATQVCVRT